MNGQMKLLEQNQGNTSGYQGKEIEAAVGQEHLVTEPDGQIEHHPHHGRGDAGERSLELPVAGHGLDKRRAGENEEKAG